MPVITTTSGIPIILFNFPKETGVVLNLPPVPPFELLCIPDPEDPANTTCTPPILADGASTAEPGYPEDPADPGNACQPSLDSSIGLCSNSNYPIWNPGSNSVNCDTPTDQITDVISGCQQAVKNDQGSLDILEEAPSCCEAPAGMIRRTLQRYKRGTKRACPADPDYVNNPVPPGSCHSTYTCSYSKFRNVCANAKSAISSRGKPSILTYLADAKDLHATSPWYQGKFNLGGGGAQRLLRSGWGLTGERVESIQPSCLQPMLIRNN